MLETEMTTAVTATATDEMTDGTTGGETTATAERTIGTQGVNLPCHQSKKGTGSVRSAREIVTVGL